MTRWAAAALVVLALLTWGRVALVDHLHDQGYFAKYPAFADRILAGDLPRDRIGDLSPLYLWLVVAMRAIGMSLHAMRTTQIIALSVGALLCAIAAKRLGGWIAAIATALLILGNRAALVNASELEPETLIFVLTAGAILALIATENVSIAAVLLGLSAIARPVALVALVLVAGWLFVRSRRKAVVFVAIALVPVAIIIAVNLALTGSAIIMQGGTQFYEGNNPLATGGGVMPRIVADLNAQSPEPDYLHVAYRLVAARATGQPISAPLSNRYWTTKSLHWIRSAPGAAFAVFAWKALLSIHNYDIYDLATTKRKADELSRFPAVPFGLIVALAIVAFLGKTNRRELVALLFFAAATVVVLVLFYVSVRQRSPLLPPLAVMAGLGVAEIVALARRSSARALLAIGGVVILTILLGIDVPPQREDDYNWHSTFRTDELRHAAFAALDRGERVQAAQLAAAASIVAVDAPPLVGRNNLRAFALDALPRTTTPEARFDLGIALMKAGAWREADGVFASIADYRPRRENRAVSSVAYYRARCAAALGAPVDMDRALAEAPGDPHVLALAATRGDVRARQLLDELHDPFTRDWALALASGDAALLESVARRFPEWTRVGTTPAPR